MKNTMRTLPAILAIALFSAATVAAQAAPPAQPITADDGKDDILFIVKLTAKELKMDLVPKTAVEFPGTQQRTTAWLTERTNLPDKLEPGVTYRDIGMTLRISSRFENIEQIVREALGEVEPPSAQQAVVKPAPPTQSANKPRRKN